MGLRIRDRKTSIAIVFLIMVVIGAALVTVVPKMSVWSRSFTNERVRYEYIEPGHNISISFYAPFDRLNSLNLDMESIGERDIVTATDAHITLADEFGI